VGRREFPSLRPLAGLVLAFLVMAALLLVFLPPPVGLGLFERAAAPTVPPQPKVPAPAPEDPDPGALNVRVMSFNILASAPVAGTPQPQIPSSELALEARAPRIADQINRASADVVALQENAGDPLPYEFLRRQLPAFAWVQPDTQVPILVRTERLDVTVAGHIDLDPGAKGFLAWARVRERGTGQQLWVFNVQLRDEDTRDAALTRSTEVQRVRQQVLDLNPGLAEHFVVLGDLSADAAEGRPLYRDVLFTLSRMGLVDAAKVAVADASNVLNAGSVHGFDATIDGRRYPKVVLRDGRRTDFVLVRNGTTVRSFAVTTGPETDTVTIAGKKFARWKGVMASDHSPVSADIEFSGAAPRTGFVCWDGVSRADLASCGTPSGNAGLVYVFPRLADDLNACRLNDPSVSRRPGNTSMRCRYAAGSVLYRYWRDPTRAEKHLLNQYLGTVERTDLVLDGSVVGFVYRGRLKGGGYAATAGLLTSHFTVSAANPDGATARDDLFAAIRFRAVADLSGHPAAKRPRVATRT
jgi:endonuclease/exonuclease/phosphatase family metal-dependent hydrolase